jgi:hypothetical protein
MKNELNPCPECGQKFDNVFEATDHLLEEDDEFDPALVLPNGYRLMIGSLLRCMYRYAEEPEQIRSITQDTYMTLFTAETQPDVILDVIEDMIVGSSMVGIDDELKQLLEDGE